MLWALHFSFFLVSSSEDFLFISFQQKNEMKKGNTLTVLKYLLFSRVEICLTSKISKENLADGNLLENVF